MYQRAPHPDELYHGLWGSHKYIKKVRSGNGWRYIYDTVNKIGAGAQGLMRGAQRRMQYSVNRFKNRNAAHNQRALYKNGRPNYAAQQREAHQGYGKSFDGRNARTNQYFDGRGKFVRTSTAKVNTSQHRTNAARAKYAGGTRPQIRRTQHSTTAAARRQVGLNKRYNQRQFYSYAGRAKNPSTSVSSSRVTAGRRNASIAKTNRWLADQQRSIKRNQIQADRTGTGKNIYSKRGRNAAKKNDWKKRQAKQNGRLRASTAGNGRRRSTSQTGRYKASTVGSARRRSTRNYR